MDWNWSVSKESSEVEGEVGMRYANATGWGSYETGQKKKRPRERLVLSFHSSHPHTETAKAASDDPIIALNLLNLLYLGRFCFQ